MKEKVINGGCKTILTTTAISLNMSKSLRAVKKAAEKLGIQGGKYPTEVEVAAVRQLLRIEKEVHKGVCV